jgi:CDP-glucose 4,6-dehydratase
MSFWSDKRVLVTGGTGMVGSWMVKRLVAENAHVVALIRDMDTQSELWRSGVTNRINIVNGRLEDYASVERAVNEHDVDTIFHLGAQTIVGTANRSPMQTMEANIQGTWHILEAARVHPDLVKRVLVASSDKAYGDKDQLPYTEDMSLEGRAPYEVSKSCTDLISTSYAVTYGVPAAIARCGNIYGGGDLNWSRIIPGTVRSLIRGEQPVLRSDGSFLRDYVYVEDVVDAYLTLGENMGAKVQPGSAWNFSDQKPMTVMEIYKATCEAFGKPDVQPKILGQAQGEIKNQYLSSEKANRELGWSVEYGLEQGLRETVKWYQELFVG